MHEMENGKVCKISEKSEDVSVEQIDWSYILINQPLGLPPNTLQRARISTTDLWWWLLVYLGLRHWCEDALVNLMWYIIRAPWFNIRLWILWNHNNIGDMFWGEWNIVFRINWREPNAMVSHECISRIRSSLSNSVHIIIASTLL